MIGTLVLALALQSAIHAGSGGTQAIATPPASGCTTGSCSFTWVGTAGETLPTYNSGFADLSPGRTLSRISLDGSGHVQVDAYQGGGFRYTGSTSDTAQVVFIGVPGATASQTFKGVSVRSDGTADGYALEPCYANGDGTWRDICIKKNGTQIGISADSSYDPTTNMTAAISVSGTSTVTINGYVNGVLVVTATDSTSPLPPGGNPGAYADNGYYSVTQPQLGQFDDYIH